jgi:hypothetical protein
MIMNVRLLILTFRCAVLGFSSPAVSDFATSFATEGHGF